MRTMKRFLCAALLAATAQAIYPDQAGIIDWHRAHTGVPLHACLSAATPRAAVVATAAPALAAVAQTTGSLLWQQPVASAEAFAALACSDQHAATVSADGKHLRVWQLRDGALIWNNATHSAPTPRVHHAAPAPAAPAPLLAFVGDEYVAVALADSVQLWDVEDGVRVWSWATGSGRPVAALAEHAQGVVALVVQDGSVREIVLSLASGAAVRDATALKPAVAVADASATLLADPTLFVVHDAAAGQLHLYRLGAGTLASFAVNSVLPGATPAAALTGTGFPGGFVMRLSATAAVAVQVLGDQALTAKPLYTFAGVTAGSRFAAAALGSQFRVAHVGAAAVEVVDGAGSSETHALDAVHGGARLAEARLAEATDGSAVLRLLVVFEDLTVALVQGGDRQLWERPEALSTIQETEFVDLPPKKAVLSFLQSEYGDPVLGDQPKYGVVRHFVRRLSVQMAILAEYLGMGSGDADSAGDEAHMTSDQFGFHKMLVARTQVGVCGVMTEDGTLVWNRHFVRAGEAAPSIEGIYMLRRAVHAPVLAVLGQYPATLQWFVALINPVTGADTEAVQVLDHDVIQALRVNEMTEDHLHPLVLVDSAHRAHVVPATDAATRLVTAGSNSLFAFLVDEAAGRITGHQVVAAAAGGLELAERWSVALPANQELVQVAQHHPRQVVNSPARVLGDRSLLYKYINPNMIAVGTTTCQNCSGVEPTVQVMLLDTVTGRVLHHLVRPYAQGPLNMVLDENWLVYHCWDIKAHRYEVGVLELFQPATNGEREFSSFGAPLPDVAEQAYVFPTGVTTIGTTVTSHGITTKNILFGLSSNAVVSVSKRLLDPRRPHPPLKPEHKEEGLVPYNSTIPIPERNLVTYKYRVTQLRGISSAPSVLESTSLVCSFGTDLFCTRLTPSKTFDMLSDDFQFLFLGATILGLLVLTIGAATQVKKNELARKWK